LALLFRPHRENWLILPNYLSEKPGFWEIDEHWPDIGLPNELGTGVIPAKQRFENGGLLTVCPETVTAVRKHPAGDAAWHIGPNPVHGDLYISAPAGKESGTFIVRIFNIQGKLLSAKEYQKKNVMVPLDKNWESGVYLLEISSKKGRFLKKIILVR